MGWPWGGAPTSLATRITMSSRGGSRPVKLPPPFIAGLAILLFAAFFVTLWLGVVALIAAVGGWRDLACVYPYTGAGDATAIRFRGTSIMFGSGPISVGSYRNAVTVTIDAAGFELTTMVLFRFQHPPIAVPWQAVRRYREGSTFGRRWVELEIANGQRLRVFGRAATALDSALVAATPGSPR
jgi:hypothetical protein